MLSVAGAAGCVTMINRVDVPGAVTVIVPDLSFVPVFVVALILKEPFPVRFVGVKLETVSHDVALLVAFHVRLEVTLIVAALAPEVGFHVVCDILSDGGATACVTVMVRVGAPGAVTVILPVLDVVPIFAVALIVKEPLPVRFAG